MTFKSLYLIQKFPRFCRGLNRLLLSGMDLRASVGLLKEDESDERYQKLISRFEDKIVSGQSLSVAFSELLPVSGPITFSHITHIPDIKTFLADMSQFIENKLMDMKKMGNILMYPMFLLCATLCTIGVFVAVLLPMYQSFFSEMNMAIPPTLNAVIFAGNWARDHRQWFIFGSVLILLIGGYPFIRMCHSKFMQMLFPFGVSDLFWGWSILLSQGISIKEVIISFQVPTHHSLYSGYEKFKNEFLETGYFADSLLTHFPLSRLEQEMIIHAEKSGCLAEMLREVSAVMKENEAEKFQKFIQWIQPVMLLVLGSFILVLIYLTFVPMMTLITQV